jgi:hypothetical protein
MYAGMGLIQHTSELERNPYSRRLVIFAVTVEYTLTGIINRTR